MPAALARRRHTARIETPKGGRSAGAVSTSRANTEPSTRLMSGVFTWFSLSILGLRMRIACRAPQIAGNSR
jgi:hypothetical protein